MIERFRLLPIGRRRLAGFISVLLASLALAAPGAAAISVSAENPKQGQTIEIYIQLPAATDPSAPGKAPQVSFAGHTYQTFAVSSIPPAAPEYSVLVSIPADLKPGSYSIDCRDQKKTVTVVAGGFPVQKIRLPGGKDNFQASPGEVEAVDQAKAALSGERMWRRRFQQPASARISTVFGVKRVVNGHLLPDYFHSGLDYAAPAGSAVRACAPGKVILAAQSFKLHGKTVAVDHGQGVVSFYIHLQKILVKTGDTVKSGQVIGRVGQTGRANGPHLHFSLYVNQVATNPVDWFKRVF